MPETEELLTLSGIAEILANRHELGEPEEVLRRVRYFTTAGLLETVGSVHTGSGRKRLYTPSALIKAVVLLRLYEGGATVGRMKEYMSALQKFILGRYRTRDLLEATKGLDRPTIFLIVPDRCHDIRSAALLLEWERAMQQLANNRKVDVLLIQIERFL